MKWDIQVREGRCDSFRCSSPVVVPGESVRLVANGKQRWCKACAFNRLFELPPERSTLRVQSQPRRARIHVEGGRVVEANFAAFDRTDIGTALRKNILSQRELDRANATDGRLRQLGGDR